MRIVNNKRFYQTQIDAAQAIDGDGWDNYNGQNWQWYTLLYNPNCGLVILEARNSGDCFGDYSTKYFSSPQAFCNWATEECRNVEKLLGDIDENNAAAMVFANYIPKLSV